MSVLTLGEVSVQMGGRLLLDSVDLRVAESEIVCIVGPNGSGKTTLLDAICGDVPASGQRSILAARIGRVAQGSPLPATLTVAEVALAATGSRGAAVGLLDRFGLAEHASSFAAELSTGMRRILDLAVALSGEPSLLLLDEPSSGLSASEVEHLTDIIASWREQTGGSVVIVEHDAALVEALADRVIVIDEGRLVSVGTPSETLVTEATVRLRPPTDPAFQHALHAASQRASDAPPLTRRTISTWTLLRLGLREFAAGLTSVLMLGVLNRVLKVELGVSLAVVAPLLAALNLASPIALFIGHRSDTRPIRGLRRTPRILLGGTIAGLAVIASPTIAEGLADGLTFASVGLALALFTVMGVGMYGAGSVFFALIADITPDEERGHAASIVYLMLMGGILAGVALTGTILRPDASNLSTLFTTAGILVIALTFLSVWGIEEKWPKNASIDQEDLVVRLRGLLRLEQPRRFFVFMVTSTVFLFLQRAILEPFGGEVLGMDVRQTSAFEAMLTVGILAGMITAGRPWIERSGRLNAASRGMVITAAGFGVLALASLAASPAPAWLTILVIGFGQGLFSVAALSLMLGLTNTKAAALLMGLWTVAHAFAEGTATAAGGLLYEAFRALTGSAGTGYAVVFAFQALGLLACLPLVRRVDPDRFREASELL
ncbi:MAG: MFS transporter [Actinomycetota bacterium]